MLMRLACQDRPNPYARREGESEEDHAERLAEGLQKLMDSGVVQVVRNNKEG